MSAIMSPTQPNPIELPEPPKPGKAEPVPPEMPPPGRAEPEVPEPMPPSHPPGPPQPVA